MARRFDFVNISNPKKPLSKADRSTVRSQAAHSGYDTLIGPRTETSKRRRRARPQGGKQIGLVAAGTSLSQTESSSASNAPSPSAERTLTVRPSTLAPRSESYPLATQEWQAHADGAEEFDEEVISRRVTDGGQSNTDLVQVMPPMASTMLGAGRVDPFWTFPVERKPFMPAIIDHQITQLSPAIPELDALHERALLRYFTLAMSEPSLLYSMLAFASAHRAALENSPLTGDEVLWLKGMAINAINSALQDPERSLLDTTIGAVITMAGYEHSYGDRPGFHAHMIGAQKMIAMRGGLKNLGLNGLAARLAAWVDYCQAFLSFGGLYFDHGDQSTYVEADLMRTYGFKTFKEFKPFKAVS